MRTIFGIILASILMTSCSSSEKFSATAIFGNTRVATLAKNIENNDISALSDNRDYVNSVGRYGLTPLLWAVKNDDVEPETSAKLVSLGADPFWFSSEQHTSPIKYAINYKSEEYVKILIGPIKDINKFTGERLEPSALFIAITRRDPAKVVDILQKGGDVNLRNSDGDTPLLYSKANQFDIAVELLKRGADPHATNNRGDNACSLFGTPLPNLNEASRKARSNLLKELARSGLTCTNVDAE